MSLPDTNPSLLVRLRDRADEQAWFEFVELYRPAILRLARLKGLQPSDCEDLAQNVLLSVAGAIERWEPDEGRARFRTWLFTIAHRQAIDALRRRSQAAVCGGTTVQQRLDEQEARGEDSRLLRGELRRQLFQRVAALVRDEFQEQSWTAFWGLAIEGRSAADVARQTGATVGAVYAAKGRVARRLVERIREFERELPATDEA
jgi:RNA polymerase sigma-70 factor (ECF subfamily)